VTTPAARRIRWFLAAPPQVLLALLMTAVVSVVVLAVSELAAGRVNETRAEAIELRDRATHISELRAALIQAESAQRGYLLTQDQRYLQPLKDAAAQAEKASVDLKASSLNDRDALQRSADIIALAGRKLDETRVTVTQAEQGRLDLAIALLKAGFGIQLMEDLVTRCNAFETQQLAALRAKQDAITTSLLRQRFGVGVVVLINLVFLAVLANMMIRQFTLREEHRAELERQAALLERAVSERTDELSTLSTYLQTSSEREKARLARDLHDELGGILTSAKLDIAWLEGNSKAADPEVVPRLGRLAKVLDEAVDLKRRVVENLRPSLLDHLGLGAALSWYVNETCRKADLTCKLRTLDDAEVVPPEMAIAMYRLVQEGLTNSIKYAQASDAEIVIDRLPSGYRLRLSDNGVGIQDFHPDHLSHGIAGMRQRARALGGRFEVRTAPGAGTTIEAFFPLPAGAAQVRG
jgi:signal transduction histidine kinase